MGLPLLFSSGGYEATELQFGEIRGTIGKEKHCIGSSRWDGCKSEVISGYQGGIRLIHINMIQHLCPGVRGHCVFSLVLVAAATKN